MRHLEAERVGPEHLRRREVAHGEHDVVEAHDVKGRVEHRGRHWHGVSSWSTASSRAAMGPDVAVARGGGCRSSPRRGTLWLSKATATFFVSM
jgi:hypothetical protein